jgi:membrane fusion protein (multidrug efflux system)
MIRIVVAIAVLAGAGIWVVQWVQFRAAHVFENDARITTDLIAISSRVEGWVTEVPVSQGDMLDQDALIAQMDDREARLKVSELESRLGEYTAENEALSAEVKLVTAQIERRYSVQVHEAEAKKATLRTAMDQVKLRKSELNRLKPLARNRVVSPQALEKAEVEHLNAESRHQTVQAELAAARARLAEIKAEKGRIEVLERKRAQVEARRKTLVAQIEQQKLNVQDRRITSPITGVVDKVFVDKGEFVRPGQRLALIHDPNNVWVETNVRETELRHVALGAPVKIHVDSYPDSPFTGSVLRIGSAATSQFALLPNPNPSGTFTKVTQRVPVKISIKGTETRPLRPGMMVEVEIVVSGK